MFEKSQTLLVDELNRCSLLGLTLYNFHPGSSLGLITTEECVEKIAGAINHAHRQIPAVVTGTGSGRHTPVAPPRRANFVLLRCASAMRYQIFACLLCQSNAGVWSLNPVLENMCGQGSTVGGKFSELRAIIDKVRDQSRVGVCLDTCHAFAAGEPRLLFGLLPTSSRPVKSRAELDFAKVDGEHVDL